jgi:hypothetical protein
MTLPDERTRAVLYTRDFLDSLFDKGKVTKKELRESARRLLKHYPTALDIANGVGKPKDVWDSETAANYLRKKYGDPK